MERIARREAHPQVRREAQARGGSAPKRLAQEILLRKIQLKIKNEKLRIIFLRQSALTTYYLLLTTIKRIHRKKRYV
jgi:hypothetical protein